jgi:hypothetical protein
VLETEAPVRGTPLLWPNGQPGADRAARARIERLRGAFDLTTRRAQAEGHLASRKDRVSRPRAPIRPKPPTGVAHAPEAIFARFACNAGLAMPVWTRIDTCVQFKGNACACRDHESLMKASLFRKR